MLNDREVRFVMATSGFYGADSDVVDVAPYDEYAVHVEPGPGDHRDDRQLDLAGVPF